MRKADEAAFRKEWAEIQKEGRAVLSLLGHDIPITCATYQTWGGEKIRREKLNKTDK